MSERSGCHEYGTCTAAQKILRTLEASASFNDCIQLADAFKQPELDNTIAVAARPRNEGLLPEELAQLQRVLARGAALGQVKKCLPTK